MTLEHYFHTAFSFIFEQISDTGEINQTIYPNIEWVYLCCILIFFFVCIQAWPMTMTKICQTNIWVLVVILMLIPNFMKRSYSWFLSLSNPDPDLHTYPGRYEEEVGAWRIAYRARISVLLLCVPPPTGRHKQEGPVLGRLGEHRRMPWTSSKKYKILVQKYQSAFAFASYDGELR